MRVRDIIVSLLWPRFPEFVIDVVNENGEIETYYDNHGDVDNEFRPELVGISIEPLRLFPSKAILTIMMWFLILQAVLDIVTALGGSVLLPLILGPWVIVAGYIILKIYMKEIIYAAYIRLENKTIPLPTPLTKISPGLFYKIIKENNEEVSGNA